MEKFRQKGYNIIAVSYDSVHVQRMIAEKYHLDFPLLSDVGSKVIREYGIFRDDIQPGNRAYGVPHPGLYIIDKNLVVRDKDFQKSYAERPTAQNILIRYLGAQEDMPSIRFKTDYLHGILSISDTTATRGQVVAISISVHMENGYHVYGKPVPEGMIPFEIMFDPNPEFSVDHFKYPETHPLRLKNLEESLNILPKDIMAGSFLRVIPRPEYGKQKISGRIVFQACDDRVCMLPEEIPFEFPLNILRESDSKQENRLSR